MLSIDEVQRYGKEVEPDGPRAPASPRRCRCRSSRGARRMDQPIWLTEAEVASLMDIGDAIVALEAGLRREASGEAVNMVKTHALWGGRNTLHAIGAVFPADRVVGTKTWAHTTGG